MREDLSKLPDSNTTQYGVRTTTGQHEAGAKIVLCRRRLHQTGSDYHLPMGSLSLVSAGMASQGILLSSSPPVVAACAA